MKKISIRKKIKIILLTKVILIYKIILIFSLCTFLLTSFLTCKRSETGEPKTQIEEGIAKTTQEPTAVETYAEELTGIRNPFSGTEVSSENDILRPLAVIIENSLAARPQTGLIDADVVVEIVDEGGITRYVVIYSSKESDVIGPVRSARPYYAEIAKSFDSIFVFFGASKEGYERVVQLGLQDLSAAADTIGNSGIRAKARHWRDSSRVAPHNAYMSTISLREDSKNYGYKLNGSISPFKFKNDVPESDRGDVNTVIVNFSFPSFEAKYVYDKKSNSYKKYLGGVAHIDRNSGEHIIVKNIIVQITDITGPIDQYGHMAVRTTGQGEALYFIDGKVIEGTWIRNNYNEPYKYLDENGNEVKFNVGQTWISFISTLDRVNY